MSELKIGDVVARKSYGADILFKVVDIKYDGQKRIAVLKGICYRLEADAPESDLEVQPESSVREYSARVNHSAHLKERMVYESSYRNMPKKKPVRQYRTGTYGTGLYRAGAYGADELKSFPRPGKVLHIDGDNDYLYTCLDQYKKFGIEAAGVYVKEKDQPFKVYNLLKEHRPDILVLTGHDGVIKDNKGYSSADNYRNSQYFIDSVKEARRYDCNLDSLIVFAGACQSMYNKIIEAGANYASSPYRVLIHALDPVFICQKVAFTGINKVINPQDVISTTITGVKGIGGIETRGKYRFGYPPEPYN